MAEPEERWRIKEFASRLGVQEPTLRAWERRYHLLQPERSSGGFRLYSAADEQRVRSMQAHMARGIGAAQAAALALAESARDVVAADRPNDLVDALIAAAEEFDVTRFDTLLDTAFAHGRLVGIRDVVLPMLVEVGARWERDELSVGDEHLTSHLLERRLLAMARGWEAGSGPLALLACPPGERHTLGLVCCGLLLAEHGWRIAYLGADTPLDQIAALSQSIRPVAVVLSSLHPQSLLQDAGALAALGRRHHTVLGGRDVSAELAERLGVHRAAGGPVATAQALAERPPRRRARTAAP